MKKQLIIPFTAIMLTLFSLSTWADDIDFTSEAQCNTALDNYYQQATQLDDFFKGLAYQKWFLNFKTSPNQKEEHCEKDSCQTIFHLGGCGTLAFPNPALFNLVKPMLEKELAKFHAQEDSLDSTDLSITCLHPKGKDPIQAGQCQLSYPQ